MKTAEHILSVYFDDAPILSVTAPEADAFLETSRDRIYRDRFHFLIVEDQVFSQKLLSEFLSRVRVRTSTEEPVIDVVHGLQTAWTLYLHTVPNIVFLDLKLTDGSGHTLARAIKDLDPTSCVIIVTANNFEEELAVARQIGVDDFIAKPYNKKQILECVERYIATLSAETKGMHHGAPR